MLLRLLRRCRRPRTALRHERGLRPPGGRRPPETPLPPPLLPPNNGLPSTLNARATNDNQPPPGHSPAPGGPPKNATGGSPDSARDTLPHYLPGPRGGLPPRRLVLLAAICLGARTHARASMHQGASLQPPATTNPLPPPCEALLGGQAYSPTATHTLAAPTRDNGPQHRLFRGAALRGLPTPHRSVPTTNPTMTTSRFSLLPCLPPTLPPSPARPSPLPPTMPVVTPPPQAQRISPHG